MNKKVISILRWVGVLPTAALANGVAFLAFYLLNMCDFPREVFQWMLDNIARAVCAPFFVIAGASMAPAHKFAISVVLAVLFFLVMLQNVIFGYFFNGLYFTGTFKIVAVVLGLLIGCYAVKKEL